MKKTHKMICLTTLIICFCSGAMVYASFEALTSNSFIEAKQIANIKNDLDMDEIQSEFAEETYIDENGEMQTIEGIEIECSVDDLVKKYHTVDGFSVIDKEDSIFDNLSDDYLYYLPIKHNNIVVGMANIKIGKSVTEVEKNILNLNLSEEFKNKIIAKAKKNEGKWYVSSISRYMEGEGYILPEQLEEKLIKYGITDIEDIKYTSIDDYAREAYCIKTQDNEYIIPINLLSCVSGVKNQSVYSAEQVISSIT